MFRIFVFVLLGWVGLSVANAHLMLAQRGTLNFVGNGAFMVLSVPVSALVGTDDDGDGLLSVAELTKHHRAVVATLQKELQLFGPSGVRPLEGLMLTISPPDETPSAPAPQLIVMGRFSLPANDEPLHLQIGLFGKKSAEQAYQVTVTRNGQKQLLTFSFDRNTNAIFPSSWKVFSDNLQLGIEHIVIGLDHLLFLIVILAAGWNWRQVLVTLSIFTVGHALTLMLSVLGGVTIPPAIVEPTIAATIVGMASYELYARRVNRFQAPRIRMFLVFGCALIHGLGLASALSGLGLEGKNQLLSLAGFNIGIELGQLAIACVFIGIVFLLKHIWGERTITLTSQVTSWAAIGIGSVWFLQRVIYF